MLFDAVLDARFAAADCLQSQLAALVVELLEEAEIVAPVALLGDYFSLSLRADLPRNLVGVAIGDRGCEVLTGLTTVS